MERVVDRGVVVTALPLPGTPDEIVLLDPDRRPEGVLEWHPFDNVLRVGPGGSVRWRAEVPAHETTWKCWLQISFDGRLRAWTGSHVCELDLDTGQVIRSEFTK